VKHFIHIICSFAWINCYAQSPVINRFTPTKGDSGTVIKIFGNYFTGATAVHFGNTPAAAFVVDSAKTITATAGNGSPGFVRVTTPLGMDSLNGYKVPTINSFTPAVGNDLTTMTIRGTNFTGTVSVTIGGVNVGEYTVVNDTTISCRVGKVSTGSVAVTNLFGTIAKAGFIYNGVPVITSFSPDSGVANTLVTILGTGFNITNPNNNLVNFGAVRADVVAVTAGSLVVKAPPGADYQPITVTSNELTCYSNHPFYITFTDNNLPFNNSLFARHNYPGLFDFSVVADFNRDRRQDIVGVSSDRVMPLKNVSTNGTLDFLPQTTVTGGGNATAAVSAFFDGDSLPDLVVTSSNNYIHVYKNTSSNTDITFNYTAAVYTAQTTVSPVAHDLSGDGKPDFVVANYYGNSISTYRNTCNNCAAPTFARTDFATGTTPSAVAVGDVDGDALPDIMVSNQGSADISVFRNISEYNSFYFDNRVNFAALPSPRSILTTDVDKDGKLDVVVANNSHISVFRNNSTPGNISFLPRIDYLVQNGVRKVINGDMDGDAVPEMIAINTFDTLTIFKNNSVPGSVNLVKHTLWGIPLSSEKAVVSDLNFDGKADIVINGAVLRNKTDELPVIAGFFPTTVLVSDTVLIRGRNLTGVHTVNFGNIPVIAFKLISDTLIMAAAGVPVTGNVKVVNDYGSSELGTIKVVTIPSIQSFSPTQGPVGTAVTIKGSGFSNIAAENYVAFGRIRATVVSATDTTIVAVVPPGGSFTPITVTLPAVRLTASAAMPFMVTYTGAGASFTGSSFAPPLEFLRDNSTAGLVSADINTDGKPDLLIGKPGSVSPPSGGYFSTYLNTSTPGNISFANKVNKTTPVNPLSYACSDMNADGKEDVVIGNNSDGDILTLYYNNTTSNIVDYNPVLTLNRGGVYGGEVSLSDLDMDGRNDIVQRVPDAAATRILRNTTNQQRNSFGTLSVLQPTGPFVLCDYDGDGKSDYISAIGMAFYKNISTIGNINFELRQYLLGVSTGNVEVNAADFDNDGKPDIAYLSGASPNTYSVIRNTSTGTTVSAAPVIDSAFMNPRYMRLGDMDGDGKVDIVLTVSTGDSVAVIKNLCTPGIIRFARPMYYKTGTIVNNVLLTDVDTDGKLDIVTLNNGIIGSTIRAFSVFRNRIGEPQLGAACPGGNITFTSNITGNSYQWQLKTGTGYTNITNNAFYTGTSTSTLQIQNASSGWYGNTYRCVVDGSNSYEYSLLFKNVWTGAASNAWENPANWLCSSVPDINTDVEINSGTVNVSGNTTVRSLKLNAGVNFTVNAGVVFTVLY
jgi:FG-GAP-like repeat/IPT/TIG domain